MLRWVKHTKTVKGQSGRSGAVAKVLIDWQLSCFVLLYEYESVTNVTNLNTILILGIISIGIVDKTTRHKTNLLAENIHKLNKDHFKLKVQVGVVSNVLRNNLAVWIWFAGDLKHIQLVYITALALVVNL